MRRAVEGLRLAPALVLVDGNQLPVLRVPAEAIVNGDATVAAISAASILAKVHRDRLCLELHAATRSTASTRTRATPRPNTCVRCVSTAPARRTAAALRRCVRRWTRCELRDGPLRQGGPVTERTRIASRDNALLVRVRRLNAAPDAYRKLGQVWLEGDHLVRAALARGWRLQELLVTAQREGDAALQPLWAQAPRLRVVDDSLWAGIGSLSSKAPVAALAAWPGELPVRPGQRSVVLDRVQDAGNLGSILRSAAALGVAQVVALKGMRGAVVAQGRSCRHGRALRAAFDRGRRRVDARAARGAPGGQQPARECLADRQPAAGPLCAGCSATRARVLRHRCHARCAMQVTIPQPGGEESLNVAAAAAVCLYESMRRRNAQQGQ